MRLNQSELLYLILRSIRDAGWDVLVLEASKPFLLQVFREGDRSFPVRVYIWNCTHGGGAARAKDEYRVQFTGVVPIDHEDASTLLLGWHGGYEVFAGWDIRYHDGQDSASPSAQVREETLRQAHARQFGIGLRANGEVVVALKPEFLVDYARIARALHCTGTLDNGIEMLNDVPDLSDADVSGLAHPERRVIVSTIVRRYRSADFRRRVLGAYGHRCAMCGMQLDLLDAAHILPVAHVGSTDGTNNGVALCKIHHAAFDRNLVSFDEEFRVEISESESLRLSRANRAGGLEEFSQGLKSALILPNDRRDLPDPELISLARSVRNWVS